MCKPCIVVKISICVIPRNLESLFYMQTTLGNALILRNGTWKKIKNIMRSIFQTDYHWSFFEKYRDYGSCTDYFYEWDYEAMNEATNEYKEKERDRKERLANYRSKRGSFRYNHRRKSYIWIQEEPEEIPIPPSKREVQKTLSLLEQKDAEIWKEKIQYVYRDVAFGDVYEDGVLVEDSQNKQNIKDSIEKLEKLFSLYAEVSEKIEAHNAIHHTDDLMRSLQNVNDMISFYELAQKKSKFRKEKATYSANSHRHTSIEVVSEMRPHLSQKEIGMQIATYLKQKRGLEKTLEQHNRTKIYLSFKNSDVDSI